MKLKSHKSVSKRIKISKTKKLIIRKGRQDHFNSRDTGKQVRRKRADIKLSDANKKSIKTFIPYA